MNEDVEDKLKKAIGDECQFCGSTLKNGKCELCENERRRKYVEVSKHGKVGV